MLGLALLAAVAALAPATSAGVRVTGPEQMVFDWSRDACFELDIPDAPARVLRGADGNVQLIRSGPNARMVGRDLGHLTRECARALEPHHNPDPEAFDDEEWIEAPYTTDGRTVYALVHDEYWGQTHPGRCPSGEYVRCWYNAVTLAVSKDGGRTYTHAPAPRHRVASMPFQYLPDAGVVGVMGGSNIVRSPRDGRFYAFVHQEHPEIGARRGACLIRTKTLAKPESWRAWDGTAFGHRFPNPYEETIADPFARLCTPLVPDLAESVTWNAHLKRFLLVGSQETSRGGRGEPRTARFFFRTSSDLLQWSAPRTIMEVELVFTHRCGDPDPVAYPSLVDPASPSRSFDVSGRRGWLYFTRFNYEDCRMTLDRDLVRVPVEVSR